MNIRQDTGLIPCLSDQEVARVMDEAGRYGKTRTDRIKWKTLMALLVNYGPRISEATSLRWDMVNFEAGTITFPTNKQFKKLPDGTTERLNRTRTLPLFPQIAVLLRAHQRRVNGNPRVFPGWTSQKTGRSRAWTVFQELLKRAGIPPMRLHGLRHTAGTRLAEIDPILAQNVLGHRDLSTTAIYVHARRVKKQFAKMEPILGTRKKAPWPPSAAASDPSTDPEAERDHAPPPAAVPWGMPWAGPNPEQQPASEAPKPDEDMQRRLDRMEGAILLLMKGLGRRRDGPRRLPMHRPPLALGPGTGEAPAEAAEGSAPVPGEAEPTAAPVILPAVEGEFLDMRDLAAYSSYSPASLHKMLLHPTHPIPHYRIGGGDEKIGKILVRRSEFDAWLEQWRRAQPPPPDPDKDPEGIVPVAPPEESKPRYLLREHLAAYGLGRVCELQKVLSHSRQQAEAYLSGRCAIGVKVAKKIGEAIGVPFTQVLAWQEESMKAAEAGTPLIPDAPLAKVRSPLCEKLAHYGLDSDVRLARAMKVHRVRAAELLRGGRFGKAVARKIAEAIGGSAEEVLTWQ